MTDPDSGIQPESEPALDAKQARVQRRAGRAGGRSPVRAIVDDIQDDARRSVSVRINTSDYGRLKAVAGRLGVRESDVFRHLVRLGIARLMRVLDDGAPKADRYRLLVSLAGELGEDFGLSARECAALLGPRMAPDLTLDDDDIQLVTLSSAHPQQACALLSARLREAVAPSTLVTMLGLYLERKHSSPPSDRD